MSNEIKMFGCTIAALRESIEASPTFRLDGPGACATSILSDAQEELARGMLEEARQSINRAKWILFEYRCGRTPRN